MPQAGTTLQGRYRIQSLLGLGGMGGVYQAMDLRLGRAVALKMVALPATASAAEHALAAHEARTLAALDHPGIVSILDYFQEDGVHCLVMERIPGTNLQTRLEAAPLGMDADTVLSWMDQVCDALEYLHGRVPPVLFRDLKPANLLLDEHGRVRLVDFGIAHPWRPDQPTATLLRGAGTPGYAPLEQYGADATDPRTDVYALGATLYALLTGAAPPPAPALAAGDRCLEPLRRLRPQLDTRLDAAVMRMLAMRREDRFATIREARGALRWAALGETSSVRAFYVPVAVQIAGPAGHLPGFHCHHTVLCRGTRAQAESVMTGCQRLGMRAFLVFSRDPTTCFPGWWMVLVPRVQDSDVTSR